MIFYKNYYMHYCNPEASKKLVELKHQHLSRTRIRCHVDLRLNQVFEVRSKALDQRLLTAADPRLPPRFLEEQHGDPPRAADPPCKQTTLELVIASHGEQKTSNIKLLEVIPYPM